ncbi:MAG: inositol monophosphatase family protein, partial [Ilumatobacteraceae bacterium]
MNDTEIASFRRLCISLAREAGQLALDGRRTEMARGTNNLGTNTKSSATDLVTRYDQASESWIRDRLSQERPDDGVLGEEGTNIASRSGLHWIIDPIDGTTNFVYGYPAWGP